MPLKAQPVDCSPKRGSGAPSSTHETIGLLITELAKLGEGVAQTAKMVAGRRRISPGCLPQIRTRLIIPCTTVEKAGLRA